MKRLTGVCFFLFSSFLALDVDAQWPRGKGKGYGQISFGRATADQGFGADRNTIPLGSSTDPEDYAELAFYGYFGHGSN